MSMSSTDATARPAGLRLLIKRWLRPYLPYVHTARHLARVGRAGFGIYPRECPICGYKGRFLAEIHFPDVFRFDALCPGCGSLPRTRLLWHILTREGLLDDRQEVLHFAPETSLRTPLRAQAANYVTADLFEPGVDLKLNIEEIALPDEAQDLVICSHVLEHVNDARAIAELWRILRPRGALVVMVPLWLGWEQTYEAEPALDRRGRRLHYGRGDHLRRYGQDLLARLARPGFTVRLLAAEGPETVRFGLIPGENVLICEKSDA